MRFWQRRCVNRTTPPPTPPQKRWEGSTPSARHCCASTPTGTALARGGVRGAHQSPCFSGCSERSYPYPRKTNRSGQVRAYPDFLIGHDEKVVIWKDGTRMPVSDGLGDKSFEEKLRRASILDQLSMTRCTSSTGRSSLTDPIIEAFKPHSSPIDGLELITAVQLCLGHEKETCYRLLQWARMRVDPGVLCRRRPQSAGLLLSPRPRP
jgi:hypothetical protein